MQNRVLPWCNCLAHGARRLRMWVRVPPEAFLFSSLLAKNIRDAYHRLYLQLKPIERYAVAFLEEEYKPDFEEEMRETEVI